MRTLRSIVRWLTAGLALVIVLLSLLPLPEPPIGKFRLADKIGHTLAYLALGFLVYASQLRGPRPRRVLLAVGVSTALGAAIELVQPLAQRNAELLDLAADLLGSTVGSLLAMGAAGWLERVGLGPRSRR